ncbi:ubiquitin-like protein Pup [Actinomycetaceae bacterium TAE3-ERU4]|nr:ubiquitin-like protein Pup [Actinomycetaceae bacterium TAE3-ERU4]
MAERQYQQRNLEEESSLESEAVLPYVPTEKNLQMDEILDEIDEVLASTAQEFVDSYVQQGGQ